ncbi:stage VI sporulation protein D [Virgibacillus ainsalahensis]
MSNDQPVFSFELNESLYFEKGQEVAEMRGISLDPEISIQSFSEYVSIKGVIELRGEYQKVESLEDDSPSNDFDDFHSRRYVESVIDTNEMSAEFSHRFPVEISVPSHRVEDMNDVTVSIQSFDYEIPDHSHLKLYSMIGISGINNQTEEPRKENNEEGVESEQEAEPFSMAREADDTFEFEIKEKEEKAPQDLAESFSSSEIPDLPAEIEEDTDEGTGEDNRWKYKETQTLKEFFDKQAMKDQKDGSHVSSDYSPSDSANEVEEGYEHKGEEQLSDNYENEEGRTEDMEDVSYLADMFRHSEEEAYTKMRLCIVQDKDTIESIAERYQITTLQLIKQNNLDEDFDISEGQLLRIPHIIK